MDPFRVTFHLDDDNARGKSPVVSKAAYKGGMANFRTIISNPDTGHPDTSNYIRIAKHILENNVAMSARFSESSNQPDGIIGVILQIGEDKFLEFWLRLCDEYLVGLRIVADGGAPLTDWVTFFEKAGFPSLNLKMEYSTKDFRSCSGGHAQLQSACLLFYHHLLSLQTNFGTVDHPTLSKRGNDAFEKAYKQLCVGLVEPARLRTVYAHMKSNFQAGEFNISSELITDIRGWGGYTTTRYNAWKQLPLGSRCWEIMEHRAEEKLLIALYC